jgi:hypothetical protein
VFFERKNKVFLITTKILKGREGGKDKDHGEVSG